MGLSERNPERNWFMKKKELTKVPDLKKIILELLRQIPGGMVTSYKDIADALGDPVAARAVGAVMASNKEPEKYPCWRVVHSNGKIGNYSARGGREEKMSRMENEGIGVEGGRIKNFSRVRYDKFDLNPPLPELRKIQNSLEGMVEEDSVEEPESAAGVDVSYGPEGVIAAYVEMKNSDEVVYKKSICRDRVKFPYIPGYLAFRELPLLNELLEEVRTENRLADVIIVDGNGLLHPRRAGLATHLGIVLDHPTIGIAKKLLCGKTEGADLAEGEEREVRLEGDVIGTEVKTYYRANPIYVSVGNRIRLSQAGDLVRKYSKYKLPEPLRQAHKNAKGKATEN